MVKGILTSAGAMRPALTVHSILANNLANATTAGFRQDRVAFQQLISGAADAAGQDLSGAPTLATALDLTAGAYEVTDRPFDIAIQGEGFFVVQTPAGEQYTRGGQLKLAENGLLVTPQGHPIMGEGGPLVLPADAPLSISPNGELRSGQQPIGRLRLVTLPAGSQPQHVGGGLLAVEGEVAPADGARVLQGVIEGANVEPVQAMVDMITLLRHFEMNQKALQAQDASLGHLLSWVRA
jgi:flagellar basal-body rod protein FlgF